MSHIVDYNKKIAQIVLEAVHKYIDSEERLKRGGGSWKNEKPQSIGAVNQPDSATPSNSLSGGKMKPATVLKDLGHEAQHIIAPVVRQMERSKATPKVEQPAKEAVKEEQGGKMNFVKTMKNVGKTVGKDVAKVASSKLANSIVDQGIKVMTNPAVDEGLETGAEVALMAAGMKKKHKPSRRNLLIGEIMKKQHCTLAEASAYIKAKGLK